MVEQLSEEPQWATGFACCRVCGHTWVAVFSTEESSNLECPECHAMAGEVGGSL